MRLFLQAVVEDGYTTYSITNAGYFFIVVLAVAALALISYFVNADDKFQMSIKQISVSALCLALAFVLSNVKLFKMPMGGSVTFFSMFFVAFIGYLYGPRIGLAAAFGYGLLQLIVDPYIISVPQLLCDYVLAFTALGVSGFFYKQRGGMIKGYLAAVLGRFFFSTLSGVIFFADYAPENMTPLGYSAAYNGAYLGAECALTVIILLIPVVSDALKRVRNEVTEKNIRKQVSVS